MNESNPGMQEEMMNESARKFLQIGTPIIVKAEIYPEYRNDTRLLYREAFSFPKQAIYTGWTVRLEGKIKSTTTGLYNDELIFYLSPERTIKVACFKEGPRRKEHYALFSDIEKATNK